MKKDHLPRLLKHLREASSLTVYSLAKESGLSRAYISKLESGKSNPTLESLKKLAKPLGLTLLDLVAMTEDQPVLTKTNILEVEERVSQDKSFYSYPLSSRSEAKNLEIFTFKFVGIGQHVAIRPSGSIVCVHVEKGEMIFEVNDEQVTLHSGDFIQTKISKTYKYIQKSKKYSSGFIVIRFG